MNRYIGVDPGRTTGVLVAAVSDKTGLWRVLSWAALEWEYRFELDDIVKKYMPEAVVVEEFRLFPHRAKEQIGNEFPSVRVIGMLEAYLHNLNRLHTMVMQPSSARSRVKIIHDLPTKNPHIVDAYKHLRYYLVTHNLVEA